MNKRFQVLLCVKGDCVCLLSGYYPIAPRYFCYPKALTTENLQDYDCNDFLPIKRSVKAESNIVFPPLLFIPWRYFTGFIETHLDINSHYVTFACRNK